MKLDPSKPVKAVSITQLADGCMASQLEEMLSKIEDFGTTFHDGWVPSRYAWLGLQSTIWSLLSYPLAACSFSKAEADRLMSALYKLILLTLGASKSLPNVYCFAPLSLQGLEAPNFYVEQGIHKVSKLLTHGDSSNLTSDLITVSMEHAQLEVGIGTPLLQAPFDQYGMLCTQCWVKGLWQFASEHHILLENPTYHTPLLQCKGNEYIMECLVLMDYYGNADLICINRCQIRKQVLTMSDIICGIGVYLHHDAHTFIPMLQHPSKYDWANEWQPSHSDWNLWRAALKILTSQNLLLPFFDRLSCWTKSPHTPSEWQYSPTTQCLYKSLLGGNSTAMLHERTTAMLASSSGNSPLHHSLPIPALLLHISTGVAMLS